MMTRAEWERRYVEAFAAAIRPYMDTDEEATEAANNDLQDSGFELLHTGYEDNPEAAAHLAVSNYGEDEDED